MAQSLTSAPDGHARPWPIDATLIPVHDQAISAPAKNYRRSINTQIIICAHRRHVVAVGDCWPGNRDAAVARHTIAHLLDGTRLILGDGGYRDVTTTITATRDTTAGIIRDDHYRIHGRIRVRVEHVIARLKDWQMLRQCRRRGNAINHCLQTITGLWNLKTHKPLRVNS